MKVEKFEDLEVWKLSIKLSSDVFQVISNGSFSKDYKLKDQFWGSVISISSNIAEGFERFNNNEFKYFLKVAKGSAGEARSQVLIAFKVGYVSEKEYGDFDNRLRNISRKLSNLISYLTKVKNNKEFTKR